MKDSNTEYLIFNKLTHEYITTYYNENTLKTLDLERCYYTVVNKVKQEKTVQVVKPKTEVNYDRKSSVGLSSISSNNQQHDTSLLNTTNVILYSALLDDVSSNNYRSCDNSSSNSSHSDSYSSYSSSGSSSDSGYSSSSCSSDSSSW